MINLVEPTHYSHLCIHPGVDEVHWDLHVLWLVLELAGHVGNPTCPQESSKQGCKKRKKWRRILWRSPTHQISCPWPALPPSVHRFRLWRIHTPSPALTPLCLPFLASGIYNLLWKTIISCEVKAIQGYMSKLTSNDHSKPEFTKLFWWVRGSLDWNYNT